MVNKLHIVSIWACVPCITPIITVEKYKLHVEWLERRQNKWVCPKNERPLNPNMNHYFPNEHGCFSPDFLRRSDLRSFRCWAWASSASLHPEVCRCRTRATPVEVDGGLSPEGLSSCFNLSYRCPHPLKCSVHKNFPRLKCRHVWKSWLDTGTDSASERH